jgi:hypothetical protein
MNAVDDQARQKLQALLSAGVIKVEDAMRMHGHLRNTILNDLGLISYRADLAGPTKQSWDTFAAIMGEIIRNWTR